MKWEMPEGPVVLEPQDSPGHPMSPWFAEARRIRRQRYAGRKAPAVPRTRALVTMVHNEPVFLPLWLRYYSRYFEPDSIYVLDNESDDGSTDDGGFVRIPVRNREVDHTWMVRTIERLQHDLLGRYDMVLVTDVDEILAPVPEWGTLGEYLDRFDEDWVNCLGYEILHLPEREPPLRLDRPILDQRRYWFPNDAYDKAALATVPMSWRPGFHGRSDYHFNLDPDLRLIHLHRMDYEICRDRHRTRSRRAWHRRDVEEGWAAHNRLIEGDEFERWFREDSCFSGIEIVLEQIPASWRGAF
jgi:hypothetical protein